MANVNILTTYTTYFDEIRIYLNLPKYIIYNMYRVVVDIYYICT